MSDVAGLCMSHGIMQRLVIASLIPYDSRYTIQGYYESFSIEQSNELVADVSAKSLLSSSFAIGVSKIILDKSVRKELGHFQGMIHFHSVIHHFQNGLIPCTSPIYVLPHQTIVRTPYEGPTSPYLLYS